LKILAIDTSGQEASAAVFELRVESCELRVKPVGEIFLNARTGEKSWTHSEILMPAVQQLFHLTRLVPQEITHVAYTCGPGSFTGLRIGAASALGIARALEIPAIPVPTLDALAYNAVGTGESASIVPMLDARRGQVYTAVYAHWDGGEIRQIGAYTASPVAEILEQLSDDRQKIFIGDGVDANIDEIRKKFPYALYPAANNSRTRAASAAVWAAEKIFEGVDFPSVPELLYVRQPQAVRTAAQTK